MNYGDRWVTIRTFKTTGRPLPAAKRRHTS
nr:MAG TPA: hypothetical protein [Caudoviricetes sp.]